MIYTRYHKARAEKVAAERAIIRRQDAEIRGEAPAQMQAPAPEPKPVPPPAAQPQQNHKRR